MKKLLLAVFIAACVFVISDTAQAAPYLDVINYSQYMTIGSGHTFNFNLNDDVLTTGDIGSEDMINSATLGINFTDDETDRWYNPLSYEIALTVADCNMYLREVQTELWTANVLSQVQSDHTLRVSVFSTLGDFTLGSASLSGDYTDRPAGSASPVPEPATMALLGMGVLGLVGLRKKKA